MLMPSIFSNDLFDDFFGAPFRGYGQVASGSHEMMRTDVRELEGGYEVTMDLPGVKKEDVKAELKDGYLTINASSNSQKEEKDKDGRYIRRERYSGSCRRSFYVGDQLRQEDIQASFENGVLKLKFPKETPKAVEEAPRYITING